MILEVLLVMAWCIVFQPLAFLYLYMGYKLITNRGPLTPKTDVAMGLLSITLSATFQIFVLLPLKHFL